MQGHNGSIVDDTVPVEGQEETSGGEDNEVVEDEPVVVVVVVGVAVLPVT
jgi:hypothetical protein